MKGRFVLVLFCAFFFFLRKKKSFDVERSRHFAN